MIVIAIDGPAGVGKSTISKKIAEEYNLAYLDTGAMYRAVTWWCQKQNIDFSDIDAISRATLNFIQHKLRLTLNAKKPEVYCDDTNISQVIRTSEISSSVSQIATISSVRDILVRAQKDIIKEQRNINSVSCGRGIVVEGRDTTTVVAPKADVRVLLTARESIRQKRRMRQSKKLHVQTEDVGKRDRIDSHTTSFLKAAPGVVTIDNSDISLKQTLNAFNRIIQAAIKRRQEEGNPCFPQQNSQQNFVNDNFSDNDVKDDYYDSSQRNEEDAQSQRAHVIHDALENDNSLGKSREDRKRVHEEGEEEHTIEKSYNDEAFYNPSSSHFLEENYILSPEDEELLDFSASADEEDSASHRPLGTIAIIGRPNVGKSTLINRILGYKAAIVEDQPGVTRDCLNYDAEWDGKYFVLMDTGGWDIHARGIGKAVAQQTEAAIKIADVLLLVVDGKTGLLTEDQELVSMARKSGKPIILAINKVDRAEDDYEVANFWKLGLGEPYPISASHGLGIGELLDVCVSQLEKVESLSGIQRDDSLPRVALVGKPNVGKSSLLNQLAHFQRSLVSKEAGTTRDPVDEVITLGGKQWLFIDTAGLRKKSNQASGVEYYSLLRTQNAIRQADVALVLFDVSESISEQDLRVMTQAIDSGLALVLLFNKWDLLDDNGRARTERLYKSEFTRVLWAERINLSAKSGWHTNRIAAAMEKALNSWSKRIPTGKLNTFLNKIQNEHPHPLKGGKQPRILFATQPSSQPPRFVIFTTGFLDPAYRRFLEKRLREEFDFTGSPIEISVRIRERKRR